MGYQTDFAGKFKINEPITKEFMKYINRFSKTRRMMRDNEMLKMIYPNWKDFCFNGELGKEGEYFAPDTTKNLFGQNHDASIINYNYPPDSQPELWCDWSISCEKEIDDDNIMGYLAWNGAEKFYSYVKWLEYLIDNFFKPTNLTLTGAVLAVGEEEKDATYIIIENNIINTYDVCSENIEDIKHKYEKNLELLSSIKEVETTPEELFDRYWDY